MKNRILSAITIFAIIVLTACLFVSCNDEVIVTRNNESSYTEVLESNGAFLYNEQRYETFQTVVDAIAKDGGVQKGPITLAGDIKTRGITIPESTHIEIDLSGYELRFYDVTTSAITVGGNSSLTATNGTIHMVDKADSISAISAGGENSTVILSDNLKIEAEGQRALVLDSGSVTTIDETVVVEGTVIARGGKDNTGLMISNILDDVRMEGASLVITGSGSATVNENTGDNEYTVSPTATLVDTTGTIDPGHIKSGICYIIRTGEICTYGSLREAFESLENDNEVIIFLGNEDTGAIEELTLYRPAAIDLNGFSSKTNNITLAPGADLTIVDTPSFKGTLTSAPDGVSSLILEDAVIESNIDITGSLTATNTIFKGTVNAGGDVHLTGSAAEAEVFAKGKLTAELAVFDKAVTAGSIKDSGSIFKSDITAEGEIDLKASKLMNAESSVSSTAAGNIVLTDVEGVVSLISTGSAEEDSKATACGSVTIIGNEADIVLEIGEIRAVHEAGSAVFYGDIIILGNEEQNVLVTGSVTGKDITAEYVTFDSLNKAQALTGKTVHLSAVEFTENDGTTPYTAFYSISSTGEDYESLYSILLASAAGRTGGITAAKGSIYAKATVDARLTTGALTAAADAHVYGDTEIYVIIDGPVNASKLYTDSVTALGKVELTDGLISTLTVFHETVSAKTITDNKSIFNADVTTVGNIVFDETILVSTPDVVSASGELRMNLANGTAGDLSANTIWIDTDNEKTLLLSTGNITAVEAITITSNAKNAVQVNGDISGLSLGASYTNVSGDVTLSGGMLCANSVFNGTVSANDIAAFNSTFRKDITAKGDMSLSGSVLDSGSTETDPALTATGNLTLIDVTGIAADVKGANVSIENALSKATLTTGKVDAVTAAYATGNSDYKVTVGGTVTAVSLNATHAVIEGAVTLTGDLTSDNTVFDNTIAAVVVTDNGSSFHDDIVAKGDVTLTGSVFFYEAPVTSEGDILMTKVTGLAGDLKAVNIKIDNALAGAALTTGAIAADKDVMVGGNADHKVNVTDAVTGVDMSAAYAVVDGAVSLSGNLLAAASVFNSTIAADSVIDVNSSFFDAIVAKSDVAMGGSKFHMGAPVSAGGDIVMSDVTGLAGDLEATNVTIDNSKSDVILTTGDISAANAVSVTGNASIIAIIDGTVSGETFDVAYTTVMGAVTIGGDIHSAASFFDSTVAADNVIDEGSKFTDAVVAKGDAVLTESIFYDNAPVTADGAIYMTTVTGAAGDLTAGAEVIIANLSAKSALDTGSITAEDYVSITANLFNKVTVDGTIETGDMYTKYVTVNDYVMITGDMVSEDSVFNDKINARSVDDKRSTFQEAILSKNDVVMTGSTFGSDSTNVTSLLESITMDRVSGTAGELWALKAVTIDNSQAFGEFSASGIKAVEEVWVAGSAKYDVTIIGDISGSTVDAVFAVFNGGIMATSGDITLNDSEFDSTGDLRAAGDILLTKVIGNVGDFEAVNVTITNNQALGTLETGVLNADDAVTVSGSTTRFVTIGGATGTTLTVVNTVVDGEVEISDSVISSNSVYTVNSSVSAYTIADARSTVRGDMTAEDSLLFDNTKFETAPDLTSKAGTIQMVKTSGEAGNLDAYSVTINNHQGSATLATGHITTVDTVSITGDSKYRVTVDGVTGSALDAEFAVFTDAITANGEVTLTNSAMAGEASVTSLYDSIVMTKVTGSAGALKAYSVTINNNEASAALSTGVIAAVDAVTITGNTGKLVTVGGISAATSDINYTVLDGTVDLSGDLTSMNSIYTVNALVYAHSVTDTNGTIRGDIFAEEDVVLENPVFNITADLSSRNGDINVTKASGEVGVLKGSRVDVNNGQTTVKLSISAINAIDDVTITANAVRNVTVGDIAGASLTVAYAKVTGNVGVEGELKSTDTTFDGAVSAASVTDERGTFNGSIFASTGDITLTGTTLGAGATDAIQSAGKIVMTKVTGAAGALKAYSVGINNAQATGTLATGAIEADDAVEITGNSGKFVTVGGVKGASLDVVYTYLDGAIELTGDLTSANSVYSVNAAVTANAVYDTKGTIRGDITVAEDVILDNSTLSAVADIATKNGAIEMQKVSGEVGTLKAYSVTIRNAQATTAFATGAITADDAVAITGNQKYNVTVAGVSGSDFDAAYVKVTDAVTLTGALTSTDSVFSGAVQAASVADVRGSFGGAVTATTGDVIVTDSKFDTNEAVTAAGAIVLTNITDTVGALNAYSVTIDNTQAKGILSTGAITAKGAVGITGTATRHVYAAGVSGASLDAVNATVTAGVSLNGALTSVNSFYTGNVEAGSVSDEGGQFGGSIMATAGDVVLNGTEFYTVNLPSRYVKASGDIVMTTVTGEPGTLTAQNVTIDNTNARTDVYLYAGDINADGAVSITGKQGGMLSAEDVVASTLDIVHAAVYNVVLDGDLTAVDSTLNGAVVAASVSGVRGEFGGSIIATDGDVSLTDSVLSTSGAVTATGSIILTNIVNEVGALTAESVTIDNAKAAAALTTGLITADGDVKVTGNKNYAVTVGGVDGSDLDVAYAVVNADIDLDGALTAVDSTLNGAVVAASVSGVRGEFGGSIIATDGDVSLTDSVLSTSGAVTATGSIILTNIVNEVGALTAESVTIDNAKAAAALTTGLITADGDVKVTGNKNYAVTVGGVDGSDLDVAYAVVNAAIDLDGALTAVDSTLNGAVQAASVSGVRSGFGGSINATAGDVSLTDSVLSTSGAVTATGSIILTNIVNEVGALTAESVTIDNAKAAAALTTGLITADGDVKVTGNKNYAVTVGGVDGSDLDVAYAVVDAAVDLDGALTAVDSAFYADAPIKAASVALVRGSFGNSITATAGDVVLTESTPYSDSPITATGSIILTKITGSAGNLTAQDITIDNTGASGYLQAGDISARGAVSITGTTSSVVRVNNIVGTTLDVSYANVEGDVMLSGALTSRITGFYREVDSNASIVDEGSGFYYGISAKGDISLTDSRFESLGSDPIDVWSGSGDIVLTNVRGTVGYLKARNVTIDNAQATGTLVTGAITANGAVKVTGNSGKPVTVASVDGATLDIVHATVDGIVGLKGKLTSADSTFEGSVSATVVTDVNSTFKGNITATTGDVVLTGSVFNASVAYNSVAANGDIVMTKVTGTAGSLSANKVTIDNSKAVMTLSTGSITAGGPVSITGNAVGYVEVAKVSGADLDVSYAYVGQINIVGSMTSKFSEFSGTVQVVGSITDELGSFRKGIEAYGDISLNGSSFEYGSEPVDITSVSGNIVMENITGTTGLLKATAVTIDNTDARGYLTTGAITADGAVSVIGKANATSKIVTVGSVSGSTLDILYAVAGNVDLTGDLTSADSEFTGAVTATSVDDERSTFGGSILAETGDVTLTGSRFTSGSTTVKNVVSSFGDIVMTKVTGSAGSLGANNVTINNAQATLASGNLTIGGDIVAVSTVTLTGNSTVPVIVAGTDRYIKGTDLVANYADLMGSIDMVSKVTANYCTLGDNSSLGADTISAPTVSITGSRMKLYGIAADTLTISSPAKYDTTVSSVVTNLNARNLTVNADNEKLLVNNVEATERIAINGGTYGELPGDKFRFSGSTSSTITAGVFNGEFRFIGSAELRITGGFFNGTQRLEAGKTTINGTYSSTTGWNLTFSNLMVSNDDTASCEINSGYFKAASGTQLDTIGKSISQSSVSTTKYVDIFYDATYINGTMTALNDTKVKRAVITFHSPIVNGTLSFNYPTTVKVGGRILMEDDDFRVYSVKELNDAAGSIVWRSSGYRIYAVFDAGRYYYDYSNI